MARLVWDSVGEKMYETGVDHGVLYEPDNTGKYNNGVVWNGLVSVTESPTGAESNPQYADNIKYLDLFSNEEWGCTIEAFTYPEEFKQNDGSVQFAKGAYIGQQNRKPFGFSYRTLIGNDSEGTDHGYKLHLVYGAKASPSEKGYQTVNDSPEALTFSWEVSTTPVAVTGYRPVAHIEIDSTKANPAKLIQLETALYGDDSAGIPHLPMPDEVLTILGEVEEE